MRPLSNYLELPYTPHVEREGCTDGTWCYLGRILELDGCMAHGQTREEALQNLLEAKEHFLETMVRSGVEPPIPVIPAAEVPHTSGAQILWTFNEPNPTPLPTVAMQSHTGVVEIK